MDKYIIPGLMVAMVMICAAAIEAPPGKEFKNLKVLPKNISEKELQKIMEVDCSKALGVTCDYCHEKKANSSELDYVSDAKPEKEIARNMMRLTLDINQKHFGREKPVIGDSLMTVTCMTCHHGEPYPSSAH